MPECEWNDDRCVICTGPLPKPARRLPAHVIPEALGGTLYAPMECDRCNHHLGSAVEADAIKSAQVGLAISSLSDSLPELALRLHVGRTYVAKDGDVTLLLTRKRDRLVPRQQERGDGHILGDTDARRWMEARLRRAGASDERIAEALQSWEALEPGDQMRLDDECVLRRGRVDASTAYYAGDGPLISDRFYGLLAYRTLALGCGPGIFHERLDPVREWIREGGEGPAIIRVEQGLQGEAKPLHGLAIGRTVDGQARVRVCLFGSLLGDVTFLSIASQVKKLVYEIDLTTKGMRGEFEIG